MLASLVDRLRWKVDRSVTYVRWYRGQFALTNGRTDIWLWWGRRDFGRGHFQLGCGHRPTPLPDFDGLVPGCRSVTLILPELRLRWVYEYDLSSEWTGREWRLHEVRWAWPRLYVD